MMSPGLRTLEYACNSAETLAIGASGVLPLLELVPIAVVKMSPVSVMTEAPGAALSEKKPLKGLLTNVIDFTVVGPVKS